MRILVVDNEVVIHKLFVELLSRHEVVCAGYAGSCLAELAKNRYGLIFLDVNLPDQPGTELLKEIKSRHPDIPVVLMSGSPEYIQQVEQAKEMGALAGLVKPFNIQAVLEIVEQVDRGGAG